MVKKDHDNINNTKVGNNIMGNTKKNATKEPKEAVVFTRKQIAWATTKIVFFVTVGIIIGVVATNMVNNTVDTAVVNQVTALKANQ